MSRFVTSRVDAPKRIIKQKRLIEVAPADKCGGVITPLAHGPSGGYTQRPKKPAFFALCTCHNRILLKQAFVALVVLWVVIR